MAIRSYPSFVDKSNIKIADDPEKDLRYKLIIPFHPYAGIEDWKAFVIMKNPSAAIINHKNGIYHSDSTINRVITYFYHSQFSEVTVINLFAKYDTESSELNQYISTPEKIIGTDNNNILKQTLDSVRKDKDLVIVAWGGYPKKASVPMKHLYEDRIRLVEQMLVGKTVYYIDRMVNRFFPLHGMIWSYSHQPMEYENQFLTE